MGDQQYAFVARKEDCEWNKLLFHGPGIRTTRLFDVKAKYKHNTWRTRYLYDWYFIVIVALYSSVLKYFA